MTQNLQHATENFSAAVEIAERRWAMLKAEGVTNTRLLARYIRSLRRCSRLREHLKNLMETGRL
jgi:hypothetical protein